uniref:Putative ixodes 10 kDa peptide protein n=1 Tax=Ixodes ricinus TaxID=34613 RepID=A0A0K8R4V7_IXORI
MQLVVFAVVLILPSFLSGEFSASHTVVSNECEYYIVEGGDSACRAKSSYYARYDLKACSVICNNGERPPLPKEVCSNDEVQECTSEVKRQLRNWVSNMWKRST